MSLPGDNSYAGPLAGAPALLARLRDASMRELGLRDEVALARALLSEIIARVAERHATNGGLDATAVALLSTQLTQVQGLVNSAAAIEARARDQKLSAHVVLALLSSLRDELRRTLAGAYGGRAVELVDDAFQRLPWTGSLDARAVQEALAAGTEYDVRFRVISRDEATGQVREGAAGVPLEQLAAALAPKKPSTNANALRTLKDELAAAEAELAEEDDRDERADNGGEA